MRIVVLLVISVFLVSCAQIYPEAASLGEVCTNFHCGSYGNVYCELDGKLKLVKECDYRCARGECISEPVKKEEPAQEEKFPRSPQIPEPEDFTGKIELVRDVGTTYDLIIKEPGFVGIQFDIYHPGLDFISLTLDPSLDKVVDSNLIHPDTTRVLVFGMNIDLIPPGRVGSLRFKQEGKFQEPDLQGIILAR